MLENMKQDSETFGLLVDEEIEEEEDNWARKIYEGIQSSKNYSISDNTISIDKEIDNKENISTNQRQE